MGDDDISADVQFVVVVFLLHEFPIVAKLALVDHVLLKILYLLTVIAGWRC
jgi:hypothetical protein